ncbi:MAG: DUF2148 domain-containing protein [Candidatus Margulisiibacteriota bacterium]
MIENEKDFRPASIIEIAKQMCLAARTAPKACGKDNLEIAIVAGDDLLILSAEMKKIGEQKQNPTFLRDAENIKSAQCIVIIGTKRQTIGLRYCGFCGFENCATAEKNGGLCAFNAGDLGIAIGSAVSVAADHRLDNRLMYTIGMAAVAMGLLGHEVKIAFGIPLSVSGKNPFFDRK